MPTTNIYKNFPVYVQYFDEARAIEHLCNILQVPISRIETLLEATPELFNPDVLKLTRSEFIPFIAQVVGLGMRGDHYLGTGINPEWDAEHQALLCKEAFGYWRIKGTEPGVKKAIKLWLRWLDAEDRDRLRIVLPMGKIVGPEATLWSDYFTAYDDHVYQVVEDKQQLVSGDYQAWYTPNHSTLHHKEWLWEYEVPLQEIGTHELVYEKAAPRIGPGSHLIDHAPWQHFWLDRYPDWNRINPDIHKLNPEIISAAARPFPFCWLRPETSAEEEIVPTLLIPYEGPPIEEVCICELDGIGYGDAVVGEKGDFLTSAWPFPYLGDRRMEVHYETEIEEIGHWYPFDYCDLFGGVSTVTTIHYIEEVIITEEEVESWPAFDHFTLFGKADSTTWTQETVLYPLGEDYNVGEYDTPFGMLGHTWETTESLDYYYEVNPEIGEYDSPFGSTEIAAEYPFESQWYAGHEYVTDSVTYPITQIVPDELAFDSTWYAPSPAIAVQEDVPYLSPAGEPFDLQFYKGLETIYIEQVLLIPADPIPDELAYNNQFYAPAGGIEHIISETIVYYDDCEPGIEIEIPVDWLNPDPEAIYDENQYVVWDEEVQDYVLEQPIKIATHVFDFHDGYPFYRIGTDTFEELVFNLGPIDVPLLRCDLTLPPLPTIALWGATPVMALVQLCNVFARWSMGEILSKECSYPEVPFAIADYPLIQEMHEAVNWRAVVETNENLMVLKPVTLFWLQESDAPDLAQGKFIERVVQTRRYPSFSPENNCICLEFICEPEQLSAIRSVALFLGDRCLRWEGAIVAPLVFSTSSGFRLVQKISVESALAL